MRRRLDPGPATETPYAQGTRLPTGLGEALEALAGDAVLRAAFGAPLMSLYMQIKRSELERFEAAANKDEWLRREYFSRF